MRLNDELTAYDRSNMKYYNHLKLVFKMILSKQYLINSV